MRSLEELNLVDDFLVNSLTSHKIYGAESSRYILECILHRKIGKLTVVPQKFWSGEDIEDHGVRLDVYLDEEDGEILDIEPDIPYEDGSKTLFLYTKGTKGNPPVELRQLLHYMENSSLENAQSEGLKALHKMVTAVKQDGEVGFAYMKSFEREQRIRAEGRAEGIAEGRAETLLLILESKGTVPEALRTKILKEKDSAKLEKWIRTALSCSDPKEWIS